MPTPTATQQLPAVQAKLSTATDDFIKGQLPDWLKRATPSQINALRSLFSEHKKSQQLLHDAIGGLPPLRQFAETHFQTLLPDTLPPGVRLADLFWIKVTNAAQPDLNRFAYPRKYTYEPALARLMQGLQTGADFLLSKGLGFEGSTSLLVEADDAFIDRCRQLDVGRRYQDELDQVYNPQNLNLLAADKRNGFSLAVELAALKGHLTAWEHAALRDVAAFAPNTYGQPKPHFVSTLEMLGQTLSNTLLIELRTPANVSQGVLLYLPGDSHNALRRYVSMAEMQQTLAVELQQAGFRQALAQQVSLKQRPGFTQTLGLRLQDTQPDLSLTRGEMVEDAFLTLARLQVLQAKADARLLLVPTVDVDKAATEHSLQMWKALGIGVVNLAGLFVPAVGALLLGQLVVQTLSEVFEGVRDWSRGHQHEALQHFLSVAEVVALTGATVAGVAVVRSVFVDKLEPVALGTQQVRLWNNDLAPYETTPEDRSLQPDGLYGAGKRRWLRLQARYYEVHRPVANGSWRLRHPLDDSAYGPALVHNGERGWRLQLDQPLAWDDSARMLDCLWPQDPPVDRQTAEQILKVAGIDQDELRGVLVENRAAPITLADTLRRFAADARIEAFVRHLGNETHLPRDEELLTWLSAQREVAGPSAGLRDRLLLQLPAMRWRAFEHLAYAPRSAASVAGLVLREFPGLPKGYIPEVLKDCSAVEYAIARREQRLPLPLASKARALLRAARLTRAIEGFYLASASCSETDELAVALLRKLPAWPAGLALEVREATPQGRLVASFVPEGQGTARVQLVRINRYFQLYDAQGQALPQPHPVPATVFEALVAALSPAQLQALGIEGDDPALALREKLRAQLPASHQDCVALLGWTPQQRWFNPGQRLADGRVGYLLSGRGAVVQTPRQTLLTGLRRLFPGLDDNQLNQELEHLLQGEDMPFARLAGLQDDHEQLNRAVNHWVSAEFSNSRRASRQLIADRVLRAWRGQGERLSLGFGELASLPALPGHVHFRFVTSLVINDTAISSVPSDFLHSFTHVHYLNLSGNRLLSIPPGLSYLPQLRTLRLARNVIRLNASAVETLAGLAELTRLDLSYNPLGALHLRFNRLQQLMHLNLRHCRLGIWPQYIELCQNLQVVDLRDNQLSAVADETLQMPQAFRQVFLVGRNRLSNRQVMALYAPETIPEVLEATVDPAYVRDLWLQASPEPLQDERALAWAAMAMHRNSDAFVQLLGQLEHASDYELARPHIAGQVWALLEEMRLNDTLRNAVFEQAVDTPSGERRAVDVFTRMQLHSLQARAQANAHRLERVNEHIGLGLSLFRLDFLSLFARQTAAQVNEARENARLADPALMGLADVDVRDIDLLYRVRLREALSLPGQPQTLRNAEALGVSEASIEDARQRIERVGDIETFAEDLSQRGFWQRYLRSQHAEDFLALEHAHGERVRRFHAEQPDAPAPVRAQALENLEIEHESAMQRHSVALTRFELRTSLARQG
ncbi:hypothetical protein HU764_017450 [Pseudomonas sp. SWRI100]|uniref:NEL-type E3 ubiquitin ligase domain-containing protein n=1 Tax=Pseudomonas TaxID=286 RepID=UPI00164458B5|nr:MULTISPECIES: NEL-type E3 ubiquitin ligase domain-containing protein [Pseudomonas]MBC3498531.1 hypothetical protein [Pseudomonas sp. SWRI67]MBV4527869.1 hypothetical protein [Pseudomonas kermanshahensis]